ncbi:MAG: TonB-dependent receptor [Bacteroidota bacterium]
MRSILYFLFIAIHATGFSQSIRGKVEDTNHQALIGATVRELGTTNGAVTDINGRFQLELSQQQGQLLISYTGYLADTVVAVLGKEAHYQLEQDTRYLQEVVVKGETTFMDDLEAKHVEVITASELTKAACCNLSESFETNASVNVSFSDAVTGAKTIQMLGLAGKYVQINRENVPHIRGLNNRYGLGFVPGTWIQSIDVGKGAGTVVNGYESMTGQINLEFKKPEQSERWYFNAYGNSFGRLEFNVNHATDLTDKWSTAVLFHADWMDSEIDGNDDGFLDLPRSRQINVMNRYKYQGDRVNSQIGVHFMTDQKAGGQLGFGFGDDFATSPVYGFSNRTNRFEVFGKTGLLYPHKPYMGWGFIYSLAYQDMEGGYGRNNYDGEETTVYGNAIYQNIIGSTFHQYKTGVSILYDDFAENFADSAFSRREIVPGAYFEYTYLPGDKFTLVAGIRSDLHNLYGTYVTPRLHLRYQLNDRTTLRASAGRGYRTPNAIMENSNVLVSSRRLSILEEPEPEVSWNMGGSLVTGFEMGDREVSVVADYFYTTFENQLIYDLERASELRIYNLEGSSYAHSFQVEAAYPLNDYLKLKAAYKFYDVRATINGELQEVPFNSRHRFFANASYATKYDKWTADVTLHWYGSQRLPSTLDKPTEFQRPQRSEAYPHVIAQVSRGFRWGSIYLGSENLFNFTQDNPIIDAENPFGEQFDAAMVWGPIAGRLVYAGIRYKIK